MWPICCVLCPFLATPTRDRATFKFDTGIGEPPSHLGVRWPQNTMFCLDTHFFCLGTHFFCLGTPNLFSRHPKVRHKLYTQCQCTPGPSLSPGSSQQQRSDGLGYHAKWFHGENFMRMGGKTKG